MGSLNLGSSSHNNKMSSKASNKGVSNVLNSSENALVSPRIEGLMNKYTNVMKGWQYRWFVVDAQRGFLEYYMVVKKN